MKAPETVRNIRTMPPAIRRVVFVRILRTRWELLRFYWLSWMRPVVVLSVVTDGLEFDGPEDALTDERLA